MVFGIRVTRRPKPQTAAGWIWSSSQDAWFFFFLTAIALKLAGVISWSWWWVLSPLWIDGLVAVAVLCILVGLFALLRWDAYRHWNTYRRWDTHHR